MSSCQINDSTPTNRALIFLSNQYHPNSFNLADNTINVNEVYSSLFDTKNNQDFYPSIIIDARRNINITNQINTSVLDPKTNIANGGNILLLANGKIILQPTAFIVSNGIKGGDILLQAQDNIVLAKGAFITSNDSYDQGLLGGNITLDNKGNIELTDNNKIITETRSSQNNEPNETNRNIILKAKSLIVNNSTLNTRTSGAAKAGDIEINSNNVVFNNSSAVSEVRDNATGKGGNINIKVESVSLNNKSKLDTVNLGDSKGGDIKIIANNSVIFDDSKAINTLETSAGDNAQGGNIDIEVTNGIISISNNSSLESQTKSDGNAGDIIIQGKNIDLTNSARLITSSTLQNTKGKAGTISLNTTNTLSLNGSFVSTETNNAGIAGNIDIKADKLNIFNNSRLSATSTKIATNKGGDIIVNTNDIDINGQGSGLFAETQGQGAAGILNIKTSNLTIADGGKISATTTNTATNKGGDIIVNANNIDINGQGSGLFAETQGQGAAGSLNLTVSKLNINAGGQISAANIDGEGGSININANILTMSKAGQILTTASGKAKAGSINVKVKENITLSDPQTGIFANTNPGANGDSGNIDIDPPIFMIKDGAGIGVNSQGSGKGGNISLQAGTLTLDNNGFITAATASNQGGEINLQIQDLLWLRHDSNITATAGTAGASGNGGNITINAPFIIGFAQENSNITANAFTGKGGNIDITTNAIFGLKFSNRETEFSDITASSQFGLSGSVEIKTPDVDPTSGLVELPANLVDAESLIDKNACAIDNNQIAKGNSFVIVGKGGLPANADDLISNSSGMVEWANNSSQHKITSVIMRQREKNNQEKTGISNHTIQQAQGWIIGKDGKIILTATATNVTPYSSGLNDPNCHGR
ncbi:MAG: beta strand repeat-containing protein [Cuspidothrix sp.]